MFKIMFFPLIILGKLVKIFMKIAARLLGLSLGLVFFFVGLICTFTIVGAVIGIPLIILGLWILFKSIF
ncbi:MAG TPA: hypothetical protein VK031_02185 [Tissierellaceae bacterium]|nr:hypothetical protein [Tissierellaceae bacterium]